MGLDGFGGMRGQPGFFDIDDRLKRLSDQLETFRSAVDFELFRPELNAALSYTDRTEGGRPPFDPVLMFKILVIVIDILSDLFILRSIPGHIRSDNGPEFVAEAVQKWIAAVGTKTAYIERGSPFNADQAPHVARIQAAGTRSIRACLRQRGRLRSIDRLRRPRWRNRRP